MEERGGNTVGRIIQKCWVLEYKYVFKNGSKENRENGQIWAKQNEIFSQKQRLELNGELSSKIALSANNIRFYKNLERLKTCRKNRFY